MSLCRQASYHLIAIFFISVCVCIVFIKRPSHGKLKLINSCWQLKLVCVNATKAVGNHVCKLLVTNRTCLCSRKIFHQLFRVGKLVFDV